MKRLFKLAVAAVIATACVTGHQLIAAGNGIYGSIDLPPEALASSIVVEIDDECVVFPVDKPHWRNFHTYRDSEYGIFEYVPKDDISNSRGEFITIKYFKGDLAKTAALDYANSLRILLESKAETAQQETSFAILDTSDSEVLAEWSLKAVPDEAGNHTLTRIMNRNSYLFVLEYTGKQPIDRKSVV